MRTTNFRNNLQGDFMKILCQIPWAILWKKIPINICMSENASFPRYRVLKFLYKFGFCYLISKKKPSRFQ